MKRNDLLSAIVDGIMACVMAVAGAGCLMTAFSLQADMSEVAKSAAVFALLAVICARLPRGWLLLLLGSILGAQVLYEIDFATNLYSVLNRILSLYNNGYGWGVPDFIAECRETDVTITFQVIAAACAMLTGFGISKGVHSPSAMIALLPVLPCVVITDTVPAENYLLVMILTLSLLALTHYSRRTDARQANRLTAMLLIPLVLAGTLLFNRFPQAEYAPPDPDEGLFGVVKDLAQYFPFLQGDSGDVGEGELKPSEVLPLKEMGDRNPQYNKVMEVVASRSGVLYLRGSSYSGYTGLAWEIYPGTETLERPSGDYLIENTQTIQIRTLKATTVQYYPYYLNGAVQGSAGNTYLLSYTPLRGDWQINWLNHHPTIGVDNSIYETMRQYTQLPETTAERALVHLQQAGVTGKENVVVAAQRISDYVQNSAQYSLSPGPMYGDYDDFALWFLEESDSGYCVHFATAAAVLLRAAGIPARYVEGYMVDGKAGQVTSVWDVHAHAWVEYYVPYLGWVILESTPGNGLPVPPATEPTQPTEPTNPPTTDPTEPTRPTFPTEPTEPTEPTDPTRPTFPENPTTPTEPTAPTTPTTPTAPTQPGTATVPGTTEPVETP